MFNIDSTSTIKKLQKAQDFARSQEEMFTQLTEKWNDFLTKNKSAIEAACTKAGVGIDSMKVELTQERMSDNYNDPMIYTAQSYVVLDIRGAFIGRNKPMKHDWTYNKQEAKKLDEKSAKIELAIKEALSFATRVNINKYSLKIDRDGKIGSILCTIFIPSL